MAKILTALAVLIVVALGALLAAPLLIDWTRHKAAIEAEATRLLGVEVAIDGRIDLAFLPSVRVDLEGVRLGGEGRGLAIERVAADLSLGALTRGAVRLVELRLQAPRLEIGLDREGRTTLDIDPRRLAAIAIERLEVEGGSIAVTDPRANRVHVLHSIGLQGQAATLAGPWRIEGGASAEERRANFTIQTGRQSDQGLRLRLVVEPADAGLTLEADADARLVDGRPALVGAFRLRERAADPSGSFRAEAQGDLRFDRLTLREPRLQIPGEERPIALSGTLDAQFGPPARVDGALIARALDLDRLLGAADAPHRDVMSLLGRLFAAPIEGLPAPADGRLSLDVGTITLAGDALREVKLDVAARDGVWHLRSLEARTPGQGQLRASGALSLGAGPRRFEGPVSFSVRAPAAFAAWMAGDLLTGRRTGRPATGPIAIEARVGLEPGRLLLDDISAALAGADLRGALALDVSAAGVDRIAGRITAADADLDPLVALFSGAGAGTAWPAIDLGVVADRLRLRGIDARGVSTTVAVDPRGLVLGPTNVRSLNGVSVMAEGRFGADGSGEAVATVVGPSADEALAALRDAFGPHPLVDALIERRGRLGAVRLETRMSVDERARRVAARGRIGAVGIDADARFARTEPRLDALAATLDTADAAALIALLGVADPMPGRTGPLRLTAALELSAAGRHRARIGLDAPGGRAEAAGDVVLDRLEAPAPGLETRLAVGDAGRLFGLFGLRGLADVERLAVAGGGRLLRTGDGVRFANLDMIIGGAAVRGELGLVPGGPTRIEGALDIDAVTLEALFAPALGLFPDGTGVAFSPAPFATAAPTAVEGAIAITARRLDLGDPRLVPSDARGRLVLTPRGAAFEDLRATFAGGALEGRIALDRSPDGLALGLAARLRQARLGDLVWRVGSRPVADGRVDLDMTLSARGRSPAALVAGLQGDGRAVVTGLAVEGLSGAGFPTIERHVAANGAIDEARIAPLVAAGLAGRRAEAGALEIPVSVEAGVVRASRLASDGALRLDGRFAIDLNRFALDAEVGWPVAQGGLDPARPPRLALAFRGGLEAPERRIDARALIDALNIARLEGDVRRLERLQQEIDERDRRLREIERQEEERRARERAERERAERERAERVERERVERERAERERAPAPPPPRAQAPAADPDAFRRRIEDALGAARPEPAVGPSPGVIAPLPPPIEIRPAPALPGR